MKQLFFLFIAVMANCSPRTNESKVDASAHLQEIEKWHEERVTSLKGPTGWLNIAGLFWLKEGINTFGSAPANDVVFPEGKIADRAGLFIVKNGVVTLDAVPQSDIKVNNEIITKHIVFDPDSAKAVVMKHSSLQWFVIKRDTKLGIRLRDFESKSLEDFTGIERFPVDMKWRREATFIPTEGRTIEITNILGQTTPQPSPGKVVFTIDDKEYTLDALDEGGDEYFMIFGDLTNTKETYGAGRYVYIPKPGPDGKTVIDFNKAYNPPCAFTEFATCPLPPVQNRMNVAVPAGEKNYGHHS